MSRRIRVSMVVLALCAFGVVAAIFGDEWGQGNREPGPGARQDPCAMIGIGLVEDPDCYTENPLIQSELDHEAELGGSDPYGGADD